MNKLIEDVYHEKKNNVKDVLMTEALIIFGGVQESRKNIITINGHQFCVTVSGGDKAVCRQFYDYTSGLITYSIKNHKWYVFTKKELCISDRPTRISPDGTKAFNANGIFDDNNTIIMV
jgi:hypothetical protein